MTGENAQCQSQFNEIRLKIQIEVKIGENKGKKNDNSKRKSRENLTIIQEKIHSIRSEMTRENEEFEK